MMTRIGSDLQTYDFRDSDFFKGVFGIQMMYRDEAKSDLNSIKQNLPSESEKSERSYTVTSY